VTTFQENMTTFRQKGDIFPKKMIRLDKVRQLFQKFFAFLEEGD